MKEHFTIFINHFENVCEWNKEIVKARDQLVRLLDISLDNCDMRFHAESWVPREQIVLEGKDKSGKITIRVAAFIGIPSYRYGA